MGYNARMRQFLDAARLAAIGISVVTAVCGPAKAFVIVPTIDMGAAGTDAHSFNNASDPAGEVAAIDTAVSSIESQFSNAGTIRILFQYDSGVLGQSQDGENFVPWSNYTGQLSADSAAHPTNTVLATAVANIAAGNSATYVLGTTAFLRVGLGMSGGGTTPCYDASGAFVSGCNAVYDGIISLGNMSAALGGPGLNSKAVSVAEHEINEVLGGGGTGSTVGENLSGFLPAGQTAIGPTDLYRYQSASSTCLGVDSTPSYTTSSTAVACYSVDGGKTAIARMNQAGGGSDYGDFASGVANIQDAFYPGSTPLFTSASPEFQMLSSIGYDAPEPSSLALIAGAIGGLGWIRRRRARVGRGWVEAGWRHVAPLTSLIPRP